jgi:alcohol dehydrogenase class IV
MHDVAHEHETVLEVEAPRVKFGRGAIAEVGPEAAALGLRRIALFTDRHVGRLPLVERARASLRAAGVDVAEFDAVRIEPTDTSFREAAAFALDARVDGYVSIGGGSVIEPPKRRTSTRRTRRRSSATSMRRSARARRSRDRSRRTSPLRRRPERAASAPASRSSTSKRTT